MHCHRNSSGAIVQGVTDPSAFASDLQNAGKYGIDTTAGKPVPSFVPSFVGTYGGVAAAVNCIGAGS